LCESLPKLVLHFRYEGTRVAVKNNTTAIDLLLSGFERVEKGTAASFARFIVFHRRRRVPRVLQGDFQLSLVNFLCDF